MLLLHREIESELLIVDFRAPHSATNVARIWHNMPPNICNMSIQKCAKMIIYWMTSGQINLIWMGNGMAALQWVYIAIVLSLFVFRSPAVSLVTLHLGATYWNTKLSFFVLLANACDLCGARWNWMVQTSDTQLTKLKRLFNKHPRQLAHFRYLQQPTT